MYVLPSEKYHPYHHQTQVFSMTALHWNLRRRLGRTRLIFRCTAAYLRLVTSMKESRLVSKHGGEPSAGLCGTGEKNVLGRIHVTE